MTKIEIHTGDITDEIASIARGYEFKPYYFVTAASDEGLNKLLLNRISKFLMVATSHPDKAAMFVARDESRAVTGFAGVQILDFDTAVLGVPSGKIPFCVVGSSAREHYETSRATADALVGSILDWFREKGIVFTNIRTAALELPLIHALEKYGFYLIDNGMTAIYHKDSVTRYEKGSYDIRLFAGKDLPTVLDIMKGAYTNDRFHQEPHIPYEKAEELYQLWIRRIATDPHDQEWLLIAERKGQIKGFLQYENNKEFTEATGMGLFSYGPAAVVRDRTALGAYYTLLSFAVDDTVMRGSDYGMTRIPFGIQAILKMTLRFGPSFMTNDLTFHHWRG
ncbi:MAG: hypothetical protein NTY09_08730 [bacterium]|nr:hypothetical protein [bacterium]